MIKPQAGPLTNINEQVQAHSHAGEKLKSCRHTGVTQKKTTSLLPHRQQIKLRDHDQCLHTGNKTTSLPPHRRNTKLQACRHTGVIQTTSLPPYRRNTKLQACCHTGTIQTTSSPHHRRNTKQQTLSLQPHRQQNNFSFFFSSLFRRHTGVV